MAADTFWNNREKAQGLIDEANSLRNKIDPLARVEKELDDLRVMLELGEAEPAATQPQVEQELTRDLAKFFRELDALELRVFLNGPHDRRNCILSINAGAGGTEAQDWAEMLSRMYQRWAEARGWETEVTDALPGEGAGLKSVTMRLQGENAYGFAKAERGVHRLVRISPFDANKRRHTSFCAVDVIAEINEDIQIEVPESDIRVDVYRSSGKGGQGVNTTDSAVRITHLPTGMVVVCQNERSQIKNRASAMSVLKARLYEKKLDEQRSEMERFYGEKGEIGWGSQIRSYVLQPYQMVKDLRTEHETGNTAAVLDGEIDDFIEAGIRWRKQREAGQLG